MTPSSTPKIREWKERETLDNLSVGDVARFCDSSVASNDNCYIGLYQVSDDKKHVVLSRFSTNTIRKDELSERGYLAIRGSNGFHFVFDGANGDNNVDLIEEKEDRTTYKRLNKKLEAKGL